MKILLLILLLSCSIEIPSSKVVRSPGTDFPHRSVPNRGGAILSDTFTKYTNGKGLSGLPLYSSSLRSVSMSNPSTVDGGPNYQTAASPQKAPRSDGTQHRSSVIGHPTPLPSSPARRGGVSRLPSSSSLVDQHLDPGAGEGTHNLQPAPVTVFSDLSRLWSDPQGQEGSTPSAKVEEETLFYLELPASHAADTLWLTYWEHFLDDKATPGTIIPLIAFQGDFFQGNMGYKSYFWSPSCKDGPLFFKIRNNKSWLINTFTILPGDQVRIRKDLTNGQSYFIGPAAKFFLAQDQLASLAETQKIKAHPLMITNNPDRILSDSTAKSRYHQALNLPEILFPPMVFMPPGTEDTALIDSLFSVPLAENELIQALPNLMSNLSPAQQSWLSQQAWGEVLSISLSRLSLAKEIMLKPEYFQKYKAWKSAIPAFPPSPSLAPLFLQANYELALLDAFVYDKPLSKVLEDQQATLRDHILGRYLISGFKRREADQSASLLTGLEIIQTLWIRQQLIDLQAMALPGSPFDPTALTDLSGNPFDLDQFEGKSLVVSFWISGCKFCIKYYESTLEPVFEQFKDRNDIVFISVNADTSDKFWKENLATGRYAHPDMVNLHQDSGTGVLKQYQISSFPQKLLISPDFSLFLLTQTQYSPDLLSKMIEDMSSKNLSFSTSKTK